MRDCDAIVTGGGPGDAAVDALLTARKVVALTGAGVSVESGIPDFRSASGLWSRFDPMVYGTLTCFLLSPERSWEMFRAIWETLEGAEPNPCHRALAELETAGLLAGIVTQNIDGLHQAAGSRNVMEMHGSAARLHCLHCRGHRPATPADVEPVTIPRCEWCDRPLKPDIVLFEEPVRDLDRIDRLIADCDVMLVAGTSAQVVPASLLPARCLRGGGSVIEFNVEPTDLTRSGLGPRGVFVEGPAERTVPAVCEAVRRGRGST